VKQFLRKELNPLLTECNIGCSIVHHTPKTNNSKTDEYSSVDFRYRMSGSAELTNWARCVLTVEPTNEERVFEFRIAKAYDESGWTEPTLYFAHTRRNGGVMFWSEATEEQVRKAKGAMRNPQDIVKFLKPTPLTTDQVIGLAKADGWKDTEVKHALKSCASPDLLMAYADPGNIDNNGHHKKHDPPAVPEVNTIWVLIPVAGAVMFLSARRFRRSHTH